MVLGQRGVHPQTVAHHIGLRDGLQGLGRTDIDIATGNQGIQPLGGLLHDALVKGQLQREEVLPQPLSLGPTEDGYGSQYLARRGIAGQAAALSASVQQDALLAGEPLHEVSLSTPSLVAGLKQPGGTSTGTELGTYGVARTEPF